ncbi:alpha/beta hydrolase family protein [Sulfoacidibacillus ferrooxidans]|uniref:Peptidase S9 prolyl oligopeptidase catalytic domain-containing protein n=1 Tax=Sulfoacidibacillus ferrooxidans TaxID=2005001 RepID=A0A9X1V6R9_9BACL|nr:alpha/beta fold hydrolase [Sulfoacidibacillus ferrooxidans]MCI0181805.1 hypothetical protein [Sulfoacidibacillus ferrooxidans]
MARMTPFLSGVHRRVRIVAIYIVTCVLVSFYFIPIIHTDAMNYSEKNGEIASMSLVNLKGEIDNPHINVYKLFYWSDQQKVEAFLTEPKRKGHYPLLVFLHGGYVVADARIQHAKYGQPAIGVYSSKIITITPEYRGYMESGGSVAGMLGDTVDAQNAIRAVLSLGEVKPDDIYLWGVSMGGGVALMLASTMSDIRAVVATSPFVGYDVTVSLAQQLHESRVYDISYIEDAYGPKGSEPAKYLVRSPIDHISGIKAPVLLLQGEEDHHVMWQAVQLFYDKMRMQSKVVDIRLYATGHHTLENHHYYASMRETFNWLERYGLPGPWMKKVMENGAF